MSYRSGFSDFDDWDDDGGQDENPYEWDENQWEAFFQEEEERHQRFEELLNKYGHTEEGFKQAFKEMGWEVPDIDDDDAFDDFEDDEDPESQDIDDILEKEFGDWEPDLLGDEEEQGFAHPLFQKLYHFLNESLESLKNIEVENEDDPIVTFQKGLMEAMSKLFHAGYYNLDAHFEAPRGLILAALKRVRRSLFSSLFTIAELKQLELLKLHKLNDFHSKLTDILRDVNHELSDTRKTS